MANKNLFASIVGKLARKSDAVNEAGGRAYAMTPKQALAQYAATGCLSRTFYASADQQLAKVLELCAQVDSEFIARTAIYARQRGFMKDMPALLLAVLATRNPALLEQVFPLVIDNAKMLRNFVQIIRSGVVGRKSLGTAPKRMILRWIAARSNDALFGDSIGQSPSIADIVKMVHPKPESLERAALFGYLIGRPYDFEKLPELARKYEAFKRGDSLEVPDVPFQMLTALALSNADWKEIARNAPWQMTRMNLNTFARHLVFRDEELTMKIAARLADAETIRKARAFPYQLMTAFMAASEAVPRVVRDALQDAMEIATANVPEFEGKVYVCPDVSGSMSSAVTGHRDGATSVVRCIDVAALVTASILRRNPSAEVLPFSTRVVEVDLNVRDSIMTNAAKLAAINGGGTTCSAPLAKLNKQNAIGDLVIFVSDNESWADPLHGRGTEMMNEWNRFKVRNPNARLVAIDVQPYATTQVYERADVLNIGGFSDVVFELIAEFDRGRLAPEHWVDVIERVKFVEEVA
jgi:60 kDa SS-A/Ro ribonucleoprotein